MTRAAVLGAGGYVWRVRQSQAGTSPVAAGGDPAVVRTVPHLVFRSTALGATYGRVAMVPLTAAAGPRAFTPVSCERVYATARDALCLSADRGLVTTYRSRMLGADWSPRRDLPLTGLPSRFTTDRS